MTGVTVHLVVGPRKGNGGSHHHQHEKRVPGNAHGGEDASNIASVVVFIPARVGENVDS
jgi:hypothetical protein